MRYLPRALPTKLMLLTFILLLNACSSLHDKAQTLMDNKAYSEALKIYAEIIQSDPKDEKALIGQKKAREGMINQKLIEVRLTRLAGDNEHSLEMLLEIIKNVRDWNLYPTGAVAFTQEEESGYAVRYIAQVVTTSLNEHKPLRAAYYLYRYHLLFSQSHMDTLQEMRKDVVNSGKAHCHKLEKDCKSTRPYQSHFTILYCQYWEEKRINVIPGDKKLFSKIDLITEIKNTEEPMNDEAKIFFDKAFEKTAWYDPEGPQTLNLQLDGEYSFNQTVEDLTLTHAYKEMEPYESHELIQTKKNVPYTEFKTITRADGKLETVSVNSYRQVEDTEMGTVTRMREVTQYFPYKAKQITQTVALSAKIKQNILTSPIEWSSQVNSREVFIEHNNNLPGYGLRPQHPKIKNSEECFLASMEKLSFEYQQRWHDLWVQKFCQSPSSKLKKEELADYALRCLRETKLNPPIFARTWFQNEIGLEIPKALEVLKF